MLKLVGGQLFRIAIMTVVSGACFYIEATAQTAVPSTNIPALGQPVQDQLVEFGFPGSPVFEGMSFNDLADVVKGVVREDRSAMRGAREIAIFRQAAPAEYC